MIKNAFNALLSLKSRPMLIERINEIASTQIKAAPSNYFRSMAGPEEMAIEGHEFVISKQVLDESGFGKPKRGDVISDSEYGDLRIKEVRPMHGFSGETIGYRIRVG